MTIRSFKGVSPKLGTGAFVDDSAAVIGDVELGDDASIWPMCSIRGDVNSIHIGARSNIQDGTIIHVTHRYGELPQGHAVHIGSDVTVGHKVTLHGCRVEDLCLIGMDSVVLDGAIIRSKVLLGAGSLVPEGKDLEGGYLWLGRPAKKVRVLTEQELKWFEYSAKHYVKLKNDYMV